MGGHLRECMYEHCPLRKTLGDSEDSPHLPCPEHFAVSGSECDRRACRYHRIGEMMSRLPVDPMMARYIVAATSLGVCAEMATIDSLVSQRKRVFVMGGNGMQHFRMPSGDHESLLNVATEDESSVGTCMISLTKMKGGAGPGASGKAWTMKYCMPQTSSRPKCIETCRELGW